MVKEGTDRFGESRKCLYVPLGKKRTAAYECDEKKNSSDMFS